MVSLRPSQLLAANANEMPDQDGLVYPHKDQRWTFAEWNKKVNALSRGFKELGVEKGDVVSTLLMNGSELPTSFLSTNRIGAVFFPMNFRFAAGEAEELLNRIEPSVLIFDSSTSGIVEQVRDDIDVEHFVYVDEDSPTDTISFYDLLNEHIGESCEMVPVTDSDVNLYFHTAGTTGKPKVPVHRYGEVSANCLYYLREWDIKSEHTGLSVAPLFHIAELMDLFTPRLAAGATNVIMHSFDPEEALRLIESEECNIMFGPPAIWKGLLESNPEAYDLSSLDIGSGAAAPISEATANRIIDELPLKSFWWGYGQSEFYTISFIDLIQSKDKIGSAGRPSFDNTIRIVDPKKKREGEIDECEPNDSGEIAVEGDLGRMKGYYRDVVEGDGASATDGNDDLHYTGDAGHLDEDGTVWIEGRMSDMIISGGENIHPVAVENVLEAHPSVKEVGVTGLDHEEWGEIVTAFIELNDDETALDALDEYCIDSDDLANYKRPRQYVLLDRIPRSSAGKIRRFKLTEQFQGGDLNVVKTLRI